jgi:hypothetical protein
MLLHSTSHKDRKLKAHFAGLFSKTSPATGAKYDHPLPFAMDPENAFKAVTETKPGEGINYKNIKAHSLIMISKQLLLFHYFKEQGWPLDHTWRGLLPELDLEDVFAPDSMVPVPAWLVRDVSPDMDLFPPKYDDEYMKLLHGVGPKIRYLIAEAGYHTLAGPALDCHMRRFACCFGFCAPFLVDDEAMSQFIAKVLAPEDYPKLNELAAGIGQLLSDPLEEKGNKVRISVMNELLETSIEYDMEQEFVAFLNFYPDFNKKRRYK